MMTYKANVETVTRTVGAYLRDHFGSLIEQHHRTDTHYDTADDKITSNIYKDFLKKEYPTYGFYSEEDITQGMNVFEYTWVVDPIEGTTNYAHNIPFFATQIALLHMSQVVAAGVYLPMQDEFYYAERERGASCNGHEIHISQTPDLDKAILSVGKGTGIPNLRWWGNVNKKLAPKSRTLRFIGATGIDMCYVAAGKLDVHINHGSQAYDYAPGSLIAREAGASVLNFQSKTWNIADSDIIIGNDQLVKQVLQNI